MKSVTFQNTDSAERDKWMGWDGDLARRFFGNLSSVWAISGKPGLCSELCNQQCIKMSLTSLLAARFARLGFIPVPTCQMIDSGGWCLHGHSPVRSSYHTVPNAYTSLDLNIKVLWLSKITLVYHRHQWQKHNYHLVLLQLNIKIMTQVYALWVVFLDLYLLASKRAKDDFQKNLSSTQFLLQLHKMIMYSFF